jgi:hypothetical protein
MVSSNWEQFDLGDPPGYVRLYLKKKAQPASEKLCLKKIYDGRSSEKRKLCQWHYYLYSQIMFYIYSCNYITFTINIVV